MPRLKNARVAEIGGGAAGMAAAYALSQREGYTVTVMDGNDHCGGVATSEEAQDIWFNDGVQGGARATYNNTLELHRLHGFEADPVPLNVSFGTGEHRWGNTSEKPTPMMNRLKPEMVRFARLMRFVQWCSIPFMLIKISTLLKLLRYDQEFIDYMVLALTALFFGTGNQTRNVPAAVVARVFCDPDFRIFELDETLFVGKSSDFFAFKPLRQIYKAMQSKMEATGRVEFQLGTAVQRVERSDAGIKIDGKDFDHVIFACSAENAKKVLGAGASWMERVVLGNVNYYDDVTVTHTDFKYMKSHFDSSKDRDDVYFIRTYKHDHSLSEMGFNLSNYQPNAREAKEPIYQTIFLDEKNAGKYWTRDKIDPSKIMLTRWWRQFAHSVSHFLLVVPWTRWLQRPCARTLFAGSWLMVNTHEAATLSGFAAAYRLGAPYPFAQDNDSFGYRQFQNYLKLIHGI